MARDSAARPHELLKLRIKDVVFKISQALLNGKTGFRHVRMIVGVYRAF